ncbi:MAG: ABC transporter ATP-binding protein [Spiroplasma sp.]|nr:ABC transporter ATP-binding protein [Mycoplasmatales bacterium]
MSKNILKIENLAVTYESEDYKVQALNGINLELEKGKILGIVGETGAGKTSIALAIMQLLPIPPAVIKSGTITFNGESILDKNDDEMRHIRGEKISMIFQDPLTSLNPTMTVGSQVLESILLHKKISKEEAIENVKKLFETVGIDANRYQDYPHQFSGGMKQRIVIAIALACEPSLMIADEPTTALDVTIQAQVLTLIKELKENRDTSIIFITHDFGIVAEICDHVAVIYAGEIVEFGTVQEVFENPKHPYTIGLFASIPKLDDKIKRLHQIKGDMPDPTNLPEGCNFAPRCDKCMEKCTVKEPLDYGNKDHTVKCYLFEK